VAEAGGLRRADKSDPLGAFQRQGFERGTDEVDFIVLLGWAKYPEFRRKKATVNAVAFAEPLTGFD